MKDGQIKRSLALSGLSLLMCLALLLGTTYAWFTDSVVNNGNTIQAGSLDLEFGYRGLNETDGYDAVPENTGALFGADISWEPGRSYGYDFRVANSGSLAMKWELVLANVKATAPEGSTANIADVLEVYVTDADAADLAGQTPVGVLSAMADSAVKLGELDQTGDAAEFSLVLRMKENASNEYQNCSVTFDLLLRATQKPLETDGFGNDRYDVDAPLDFLPVSDAEGLEAAVAAGKTAVLTGDITLNEKLQADGDVTIVGNDHAITVPQGVDRVLDLSNTDKPVTVTLSGVDLQGPTSGTYTRGISLYNNKQPVTLVMDGCSLSANYYAINLASANEKVDAVIRNSTITGWCAFQTHSANANITFENCTLKGINDKEYNADNWNNFATIVVNGPAEGNPDPQGAHDCTLTFKNCRIEATQTTGNRQLLFSVRALNTTINAENCTFFVDGVQIPSTPEQLAAHIGVNSQEVADSLVVNLT